MGRAVVLVELVMVVVVVLSVRSQSRSRCGGDPERRTQGCVDTGMAAHRQCMEPLHCDLRECHVTHVRVWFGGGRLQMVRAAQASPQILCWFWLLDVRSINTKLATFITPRKLQIAALFFQNLY